MARFPKSEPEIVALAQAVIAGLAANATTYPSPPVATEELTTNVSDLIASQNAAIAASAAAKEATVAKNETLEVLKDNHHHAIVQRDRSGSVNQLATLNYLIHSKIPHLFNV